MIVERSVTELMQKIHYSCDFGKLETPEQWRGMMINKGRDSQIRALLDEIETNGFTDPITISECDNGGWHLGNGHHRMVCAILLGLDTIPTEPPRNGSGVFGPNGTTNDDKVRTNPYRWNGYEVSNWLETELAHDVNGEYLPHDDAWLNHSYGDGCSTNESSESSESNCHCRECQQVPSEPSLMYTQPFNFSHDLNPCKNELRCCQCYPVNSDDGFREAFIPVEVPGQLALAR